MKQLEVQIMGQSYLLGCPEGGDARLLEAVERVDTAMCKIRDAGKVRAPAVPVLPTAATRPSLETPVATAPAASAADAATDADVLLVSLMERLDQALGDDGRLL